MSRDFLALARANSLTLVGFTVIFAVILAAVLSPWFIPHDPLLVDIRGRLQPPSLSHWFGTDEVGRDLFSRVLLGSRLSLMTGLAVVAAALSLGTLLGCYAGLRGGVVDMIVMRLVDVVLSIPSLVLAMALTAALGPDLHNSVIALVVVFVPAYTRLARGQALNLRYNGYIESAVVSGASTWHLLRWHIVPNTLPVVLVQATQDVGTVILAAAALGFLGLGAQPPAPEWGALVGAGRQYLLDSWWCVTFPGLAIVLTAMSFNLAGDGLRDFIDPKSGGRG